MRFSLLKLLLGRISWLSYLVAFLSTSSQVLDYSFESSFRTRRAQLRTSFLSRIQNGPRKPPMFCVAFDCYRLNQARIWPGHCLCYQAQDQPSGRVGLRPGGHSRACADLCLQRLFNFNVSQPFHYSTLRNVWSLEYILRQVKEQTFLYLSRKMLPRSGCSRNPT